MRKSIIALMAGLSMLSLVSCGEKENSSPESLGELPTAAKETSTPSYIGLDFPDDIFPDPEDDPETYTHDEFFASTTVNTEEDISIVNINGVDIDINDAMHIAEFKEKTGLEYWSNGSSLSNNFYGKGFILPEDESVPPYERTVVLVEMSEQGESRLKIKEDKMDEYQVAAVHCSALSSTPFIKDRFETVFCHGIKVGTPRKEVEKALGKGSRLGSASVYYRTEDSLLVIEYEGKEADDIYLYNVTSSS